MRRCAEPPTGPGSHFAGCEPRTFTREGNRPILLTTMSTFAYKIDLQDADGRSRLQMIYIPDDGQELTEDEIFGIADTTWRVIFELHLQNGTSHELPDIDSISIASGEVNVDQVERAADVSLRYDGNATIHCQGEGLTDCICEACRQEQIH